MLRPKALSEYRPRRGFALLITILLLSFLVLLLVSLASLTRVETQVASNNQQIAQARQNALLALNIAIGELQRHLGPDQRATARADLLNSASPNPLWTGVWGNTASPEGNNPSPALLTWLVSGNENRAYTPDLGNSAEFGRITTPPAAAPTREPATVLTAANSVELLGTGTTTRTAAAYATVRAPLVNIEVPANQVPGLTGNTATTIGRFAWWADDESAKARLNLEDPHAATNPAYSFAAAQRSAIELMAVDTEPAAYAGTPIGTTTFPRTTATGRILNAPQSALAAPAGQETALRNALRARSSDYTVTAASVLADARRGGLKQDLTRILENTTPVTGPADTDLIFADPDARPASDPYFLRPPSWGVLRSYAALTTDPLPIQTPTATRMGTQPVMLWGEYGFHVSYETGASPALGTLRVHLFPKLVLWNPYTTPLAAGDYEFGIRGERFVHIDNASNTRIAGLDMRRSLMASDIISSQPVGFFRFRVSCPVLAAGQARLFTLRDADNGSEYSAAVTILEPGDRTDNSVTVTYGTPVARPARLSNLPTGGGDGEVFTYIRPLGATVPGSSLNPPDSDSHQWLARVGLGNSITSSSISISNPPPSPSSPPTTVLVKLVSQARLGNVNNALPSRWIAQGNIRAPFGSRTHIAADYGSRNNLYNGRIGTAANSPLNTDGDLVSVGQNFNLIGGSANRFTLFATPSAQRPLMSVSDLRHANLVFTDTGPAYAVGNSLADFRIPRAQTSLLPAEQSNNLTHNYRLFDHSYLLNDALWDRYFFSTAPAALTAANLADPAYRLPNARLQPLDSATVADLRDHRRAATALLSSGGFNVNSTSVQAWRAMLGALHGLPYDPVTGSSGPALNRPLSRFGRPLAGSSNPWLGFRELTTVQLDALAENIVTEIRARAATNTVGSPGPFITLSQFVNRRLVAAGPTSEAAFGLKGTLQAALDATDREGTASRRLNDIAPYNQDVASLGPTAGYDAEHFNGVIGPSVLPVSSRNAFGPGQVTQADLLAVIGPALSVRGDTFTIRTYGEVLNPLDSTQVLGKAWVEAVVQRRPDYVSPTDDAAEVAPAAVVNADNRRLGRRFTVVSFRWLSRDDI